MTLNPHPVNTRSPAKSRLCLIPKMGAAKPVQLVKSLYTDPFRWSVVKSVALFALAIYVAREMAAAEQAVQP